ncbi:ribbon-helix-helix protein, CopG family [Pseudomonas sp. IT-P176]|uniref:ribbon-helix-helix protein, CopG family n=1 Tax=Pseudomonas sp. IT-P176 TaxID=3026444 RepID=UPI0039DF470D
MSGKTKLTVQLPDEAIGHIEELAKLLSVSRTDAIRRALKTELFLLKEQRAGKKILLRDEKNDSTMEVVML